jgi:hydrogenase maturation protease
MKHPLIIGIGHQYRHDDGVGLIVARRLLALVMEGARVVERTGEGTELLETWRGEDTVAVVDAASGAGEPGTIDRFELVNGTLVGSGAGSPPGNGRVLPAAFFRSSSHQFGLAEAVELGRTLGNLPRRLIIFAIEGSDFTMGQGLTGPLARAVDGVVSAVVLELGLLGPRLEGPPVTARMEGRPPARRRTS